MIKVKYKITLAIALLFGLLVELKAQQETAAVSPAWDQSQEQWYQNPVWTIAGVIALLIFFGFIIKKNKAKY